MLLKEPTGAFGGTRTHDWPIPSIVCTSLCVNKCVLYINISYHFDAMFEMYVYDWWRCTGYTWRQINICSEVWRQPAPCFARYLDISYNVYNKNIAFERTVNSLLVLRLVLQPLTRFELWNLTIKTWSCHITDSHYHYKLPGHCLNHC